MSVHCDTHLALALFNMSVDVLGTNYNISAE
jgi:hypothetical protein